MITTKSSGIAKFDWETNAFYAWVFTTRVGADAAKMPPKWYLCDSIPAPLPSGPEAELGEEGEEGDDDPRRTQPLRDTGLFLSFSRLEPTPEAILKFAEVHGFLGRPITTTVRVPGPDKNTESKGEALEDWQREIRSIRATVDLWQAIQEGRVEQFGTLLQDVYKIYADVLSDDCLAHRSLAQILARSRSPEAILKQPYDRQPGAALDYVRLAIERKLERQLSADVELSGKGGAIRFRPHTLLGAIWLQFAHAVAYQKVFRDCELCGTPFEISLEAARTTRMYCSTRCKIQAYRKRRAEAQVLHTGGMPPGEIARRLNSDLETVSGWLGAAAHPGLKGRRSKPQKEQGDKSRDHPA